MLFTSLLSDVLPGRFSVIRLLDVHKDHALLPTEAANAEVPCPEDPARMCQVVQASGDWGQKAREELLGVEERSHRGDPEFKTLLETHLAQVSYNSNFALSFWAAKGVFESHATGGFQSSRRYVIWLSDGNDESGRALGPSLAALSEDGVKIVAMVFGDGDTSIPEAHNVQVSTQKGLMDATAQLLSSVVAATHYSSGLVTTQPEFEVREDVEDAWFSVWGDTTLGNVTLENSEGQVGAHYAQDRWATAGAYRVGHFVRPTAGTWRLLWMAAAVRFPMRLYSDQ